MNHSLNNVRSSCHSQMNHNIFRSKPSFNIVWRKKKLFPYSLIFGDFNQYTIYDKSNSYFLRELFPKKHNYIWPGTWFWASSLLALFWIGIVNLSVLKPIIGQLSTMLFHHQFLLIYLTSLLRWHEEKLLGTYSMKIFIGPVTMCSWYHMLRCN